MNKKFVIIGGDAAGMSAASKIRRLHPEAELVVFERSQYMSFAACGIPYWISGVIDSGSKLQVLTPEIALKKRNIDVRIGHEVTRIDTQNSTIVVQNLDSGEVFTESFDSLLIASGARAAVPPIPGIESEGVFFLRSLGDGHMIKDYLATRSIAHATIIGGGYIGLEMAESLNHLGIKVSLVEMLDQIAPTFDKDIMAELTEHVVEKGVDLRLETRVSSIERSGDKISVQTSSGDIQTDLVIVSTGVKPNSELARDAGISIHGSGAILVDDHMQSSVANIYAAGDCATHRHILLDEPVWIPLAPSANKGGRIAGQNMSGGSAIFPGTLGTAVVKVFDFTIAQTGLTEKQARQSTGIGEVETTTITGDSRAHYYPGSTPINIKVVVDKSSKRLLGAQMTGRADVAKRLDVLATAITAQMTVEDIGMLDLTYAPPFAPVYDPIHIAANVANK